MNTIKQSDSTNDFVLTQDGTDYAIATGVEAYGIIIADAIRTLVGELQLDVQRGIDYENTVFSSASKLIQWKSDVQDAVSEFDFVVSIKSFEAKVVDGNTVSYRLEVVTDSGLTVVTD
jgi:hypothetical protein